MYEELLASAPLFRDLPRRELAWLGDACREREYALGDEVLRQSSGGIGFAFITEGKALITERQDDGTEREIGICGAGATFGESWALGEDPCPINVIALEPTRVVVLPLWDFHATLREFPEIAIHLLAVVGRRVRSQAVEDPAI